MTDGQSEAVNVPYPNLCLEPFFFSFHFDSSHDEDKTIVDEVSLVASLGPADFQSTAIEFLRFFKTQNLRVGSFTMLHYGVRL